MRHLGAAALLASFLLAQTWSTGAAAFQGENLLVPLPKDFRLGYAHSQDQMSLTEYVPKGETVGGWSRMITVQTLHGRGSQNGESFATGLASRWKAACPGGDAAKSKTGSENGYPFSLWIFECPLNPETKKPETMFLKTISGKDSFYDVQYAYRQAATAELIRPAVSYLSTVRACDTREAARACPAGMH